MRKIVATLVAVMACVRALAQTPTLYLSNIYTTHITFATTVSYVDLSSPANVAAKIVETNKNIVALKARSAFETPSSVTVIESNGAIHTFQIIYRESPDILVYDAERDFSVRRPAPVDTAVARTARRKVETAAAGEGPRGGNVAPTLEQVLREPQHLYHIADRQYGVKVVCTNVLVHNDVFYLVLTLENGSGISYTPSVASFNVVPRKVGRRTLDYTNPLTPRSSLGTLFAMPGSTVSIVYCFDKITLLRTEVFKVYVSEKQGQRNFVLTLTPDDINKARAVSGR